MNADRYNYCVENNLTILGKGQTYGDKYDICIQESINIFGKVHYNFGKLYHCYGDKYTYIIEGCNSFDSHEECFNKVCKHYNLSLNINN